MPDPSTEDQPKVPSLPTEGEHKTGGNTANGESAVARLFQNAPLLEKEKAEKAFWRMAIILWEALMLTTIYGTLYLLEYVIYRAIRWIVESDAQAIIPVSRFWILVQGGVTIVTVFVWAVHVVISAILQISLELRQLEENSILPKK